MKGFGIYVQNDLLEPKHHKAMGQSIWLYLWCLDKMTSIKEDGVGIVLGGKPIKLGEINQDLSLSDRTYTRYIEKLQESGYITAIRTPYGYSIKVTKAKKRFGKKTERTVKVAGENRKSGAQNRKSGGNKEDNTSDNTVDTTEQSSEEELKANQEDNMWNKDNSEPEIDFDGDMTLVEKKKPQTRKYPNALAVRKLFQEIQGRNPANWKVNKTQLLACENLYTERGLDKIKSALLFYEGNKDKQYCPKINSPYDLDSKWTNLGEFKIKQHE